MRISQPRISDIERAELGQHNSTPSAPTSAPSADDSSSTPTGSINNRHTTRRPITGKERSFSLLGRGLLVELRTFSLECSTKPCATGSGDASICVPFEPMGNCCQRSLHASLTCTSCM